MVKQVSTTASVGTTDRKYLAFLARQQSYFDTVAREAPVLYTTDATDLWGGFLGLLPVEERAHNTCHACRKFIETYGHLVTIGEDGSTTSVMWNQNEPLPTPIYGSAVRYLAAIVEASRVTGVFYTDQKIWGQRKTGKWRHLAIVPAPHHVYFDPSGLASPSQAMAAKLEDYKTLRAAIDTFKLPHLKGAVALLQSEQLYRADKVMVGAEWLLRLMEAIQGLRARHRTNLIWRAVGTAPAGFCHPRSTMLGTLMDDLGRGVSIASIQERFARKMSPIAYQRPQAAPTEGQIEAAEHRVHQLKIAGALDRRFAYMSDIWHRALWKTDNPVPSVPRYTVGGVFSQLQPRTSTPAPTWNGRGQMDVQPITWEKFARTVLPRALKVEVLAPVHGPYAGLATAVSASVPPILQWDDPKARNPVSHYLHHGGSPAEAWSLRANTWYDVPIIVLQPSMWNGGYEHQGKGVLFVVPEARDVYGAGAGNALFPETLKSELHAIRATIEAYSRSSAFKGDQQRAIAGLLCQSGNTAWNVRVRIVLNGVQLDFLLERWD